MGFLGRLVKNIFAPAEEPQPVSTSPNQRHLESLLNVRRALTEVASAKQRLLAKTEEVKAKLPKLEEQARRALIQGREDQARLALNRRQVAVLMLQTLERQTAEVEQEEQRLTLVEQRLSTQIEAFYAKKEVLEARYSAAEAQVRINEALSGVSADLDDLGSQLAQAEERTEHMQARATAIDRLIEDGILELPGASATESLDRDLEPAGIADAVEQQLAILRGQIKKSPPANRT